MTDLELTNLLNVKGAEICTFTEDDGKWSYVLHKGEKLFGILGVKEEHIPNFIWECRIKLYEYINKCSLNPFYYPEQKTYSGIVSQAKSRMGIINSLKVL